MAGSMGKRVGRGFGLSCMGGRRMCMSCIAFRGACERMVRWIDGWMSLSVLIQWFSPVYFAFWPSIPSFEERAVSDSSVF